MINNTSRKPTANSGVRPARNSRKIKVQNGVLSDESHISYSVLGNTLTSNGSGVQTDSRLYAPGNSQAGIPGAFAAGPNVASFFNVGLFLPGTQATWVPSVGSTTNGRIWCAWLDNPELMEQWAGSLLSDQINFIKGQSSARSWPVWMEVTIPMPSSTRAKKFRTNVTVVTGEAYATSVQRYFIYCVEGAPASTSLGSFWYHDKLQLSGLGTVQAN